MKNSLQTQLALVILGSVVLSLVFTSPLFLWIVVAIFVTGFFNALWNDTIPRIFEVRRITFWEAFRLLVLGWILSGAFVRITWH